MCVSMLCMCVSALYIYKHVCVCVNDGLVHVRTCTRVYVSELVTACICVLVSGARVDVHQLYVHVHVSIKSVCVSAVCACVNFGTMCVLALRVNVSMSGTRVCRHWMCLCWC